MRTASIALSIVLSLAACDDDKGSPADTAGETTTADTSETNPDTTVPDSSEPDTTEPDTTEPDTTEPDTSEPDTSEPDVTTSPDADTSDPDTTEPVTTELVKGARCALTERVGLVNISDSFGSLSVQGAIYDVPSPFITEPEISDESCSFHLFAPQAACPESCPEGDVCGISGTCVPAQKPYSNVVVKLSDGVSEETFTNGAEAGDVYGAPTLAGRTIAIDMTFAGQRVTSLPITVPGDLGDVTGVQEGEFDAPTKLTLNWTAPTAIIPLPQVDSFVFTHIPINHHAAAPTFTECLVGAGRGTLVVEGAMLEPLAVITGLEFQGIDHVRFAAAQTPVGCVEVRWSYGEYPSITTPE